MAKAPGAQPSVQALQAAMGNLFKSLGPSSGMARLRVAVTNFGRAAQRAAAGTLPASAAFRKMGSVVGSVVGMVPGLGLAGKALASFASQLPLVQAISKGGGAGLASAFESLAEAVGTVLLPVMTAVGGAVLVLTDALWAALQPALGSIFQAVISVGVPVMAAFVGALFTVARFMLGDVIPAFVKVANWAYKVATAIVEFLGPVFDWLGKAWRSVSQFVVDAASAVTDAFGGLAAALSSTVAFLADMVDALDVFGIGLAAPLKAAAAVLKPAPAGAKPVIPPGGAGPPPLIDPTIFTRMADAIPDPLGPDGMKGVMGAMLGGMRRALTETEFARFGNQGGFKGIADAWKQAQTASFRSPEEAKRDRMFMEGLGTLKRILATAEEALGIAPAVGP